MRKINYLIFLATLFSLLLVLESSTEARRDSGSSWDGESYSSFYDFFDDGYWSMRDEGWTLKLFPKRELRWSYFSERVAEKAWLYVKAKFDRDYQWDNTDSMKEQFMCHVHKAPLKDSWNIEPWKTSIGINCN